ncbi:SID1 transmembrane family member 1-like [Ischnura elegans]|uniref:SID1 transmembrane family member 1-like n=1 Tax=Ischnura elegans TaxID=197161 RepID=UPI001ED8957A|nr:SID1 transmembrane family member 1-like [Ischnura elegans]
MGAVSLTKFILFILGIPIQNSWQSIDGSNPEPGSMVNSYSLISKIIDGAYGEEYTYQVNNSIEYTIQYLNVSQWNPNQTARVSVESTSASKIFPVLIVVRQQKGILSWQLPLLVGTHSDHDKEYQKVSRTLCPSRYYALDGDNATPDEKETVIVSISSSSPIDVKFSVKVELIEDFFVQLSESKTISVSPNEPRFYGFNFPDNVNTALLLVDSEDDICTTVSIQTISCPVFDLERNVQFEGQWETMYTKGGITVMKESYPRGLYVVFVVKGDDWECTGKETTGSDSRNKSLTFVLQPGITEEYYIIATAASLVIFLLFYLLSGGVLIFHIFGNPQEPTVSGIISSTSNDIDAPDNFGEASTTSSYPRETEPSIAHSDSTLDEDDIDVMLDTEHDKDVFRTKPVLHVCDLARKNPRALQMKSQQYLWSVFTVGVFYALPVVQLVFTYQTVLRQTGNQDLCYYNFRCMHPFGSLSDANHVFSNIGYVLLGLLFIFITVHRERLHQKNGWVNRKLGIPQHFGLFYAMGAALMMEGVLSASYHVCPNHSNFQFDTSFMYVMSVLCMVKIYQTRHPDINARAYATFAALAGIVFIGMWGVLGPSTFFWIGFVTLHIITCLVLSAQIYYMKRWTIEIKAIRRVTVLWWSEFRHRPLQSITPRYPNRMVLLVLGNLCNWGLAACGIIYSFLDFASYLLAIFMANLILYLLFYIVMKLFSKEKILLQPSLYIFLSFAAWIASLFFFFHKAISWKLTPAQSRTYNQPCLIMDFFDNHDVWHFLSAASMFFSFMVLLTLDDDLIHTPRDIIPVF